MFLCCLKKHFKYANDPLTCPSVDVIEPLHIDFPLPDSPSFTLPEYMEQFYEESDINENKKWNELSFVQKRMYLDNQLLEYYENKEQQDDMEE